VRIPREFARLTIPPAADDPRPRLVTPEDVRPQLALVADAVRAHRPAIPVRNSAWWDRTLYDATSVRSGGSELRALLIEDETGPRGYALYRTKNEWDNGGSKGALMIREIMAADPVAHGALWHVLLSTDLIGEVVYGMLPVDDPLMHQLVNPRRVTPLLLDAVFVRVVDVARALTGRAYSSELDVVIDLVDDFCPWNSGHWRLSANAEAVTCAPTTEAADLTVDASTLGAAYLGGTSLQSLADAGRIIEHRPGSVDETSRAFLSSRAPWCPFVF
jgi:predicted acetyltransferase